jgi:hypothetical protein
VNTRALAVVLAASIALLLLADDASSSDSVTRVVKFVGTRNGAAAGKRVLMLRASSKYGGSPLQLVVPNADPAASKLNPDAVMNKVIKAAKPGDFLRVSYTRVRTRFVLSQVEAWTPKPGEVDPEAYEFLKIIEAAVGDKTYQAVLLSKRDREQTVLIPAIKNADGATAADAGILAQVAKLTTGDFADAQTVKTGGKTFLKWIFPYQIPQSAVFVKLRHEKAASGSAESIVTLKKGDQTVTLTVRPTRTGGPADRALLSKVRPLRANSAILYKAVEDGGKTWLIDIKSDAQKQPAGNVVMTGTFVWNGKARQTNQLKAVLTPTGRGRYKAVYTFTWGGRPKTYVGTVTGNLRRGEVSGTGDGDRRNFTFTGTARNGVITFKAFEVTGGRTRAQGNGTLRLGG